MYGLVMKPIFTLMVTSIQKTFIEVLQWFLHSAKVTACHASMNSKAINGLKARKAKQLQQIRKITVPSSENFALSQSSSRCKYRSPVIHTR